MEGRPLYRTVAMLGLFAHALSSLIHVTIVSGGDRVFFVVLLVIALGAALATRSWDKGIYVSLGASLVLEVMTFWFVFPMIQGFAASALDFAPAVIGFVGVWTALIASIRGVMRRKSPREFTDATKRKVLTAAGVIVVLVVASTALTFVNKKTVSDAEATGATTVLMHDGDKFTPERLEVSGGEEVKLLLRNDDPFAHTFTVEDYDINEVYGPGSEGIVTFTPKAGAERVKFVCEFHESMTGELVVS